MRVGEEKRSPFSRTGRRKTTTTADIRSVLFSVVVVVVRAVGRGWEGALRVYRTVLEETANENEPKLPFGNRSSVRVPIINGNRVR